MTSEVTLPITSKTCEMIKEGIITILVLSGIPSLIGGIYLIITSSNWAFSIIGVPIAMFGLIMSFVEVPLIYNIINEFYSKHKIIFKCKCESDNTITATSSEEKQ